MVETASGAAWHEFRNGFVTNGVIDTDLAAAAHKVQPEREQADYDAWEASPEEARRVIELAVEFVNAIERVLG
jgi:uncharacterized protein (UPF0332 family)